MTRQTDKRGFTLLELLIAVTILALMALLLMRIFSESTRAVDRGRSQATLDHTARLLLDRIEQDISQALVRSNAVFRIEHIDDNDALTYVSAAARHYQAGLRRDTAPLQLLAPLESSTNLYRIAAVDISAESEPREIKLTRPAQDGGAVSLTFMDLRINAARDPAQPPRWIDIIIGLVPAADIARAGQLIEAGNSARAEERIAQRERIYTRRVHMPNTGLTPAQP